MVVSFFFFLLLILLLPFPDAKALASSFDCKYTETSAGLNHNVDELLVGILKQIRLKLAEKARFQRKKRGGGGGGGGGGNGGSAAAAATRRGLASGGGAAVTRRKSAGVRVRGILDKMLGGGDSKSKSCDDLHVL